MTKFPFSLTVRAGIVLAALLAISVSVASLLAPYAAAPSAAAPTAVPLPAGVTVRDIDGGAQYYGKFPNGLPSSANYFPVGIWFESVLNSTDVPLDKAAGINTYVELTAGSNVQFIKDGGLYAIPSWTSPLASGFLLSDEADMWAGPGSTAWTGNYPGAGTVCSPADSKCGFTVQQTLVPHAPAGMMVYSNYGKGVTFWESSAEAGQFVNSYQQVVSADNYWFTDPSICAPTEGGQMLPTPRALTDAECRKASNYGWTVDRVRSFVSPKGNIPVWAFVELGHPFTEASAPTITGPEIRAAVWSSIIHGARGITYFNHSFGGDCLSQHVLRDACGAAIRPTVTAVNQQIAELAPVLNSPFVDGVATTSGSVDVAVKAYNKSLYIIANSTQAASQSVTVSLKCGGGSSATVLGENRSVAMANGSFTDAFADSNAVHIYKVEGGNGCGI
ncbi:MULTISPECIES: hypothetical protein [Arthrobacter]|uniref:hypothetical protein n=1 Tax=Arthrobacter TaxID=1663 RepID=UPI001F375A4E|nr:MULTISPECIES: hypothetical protein [Arthrobacter]